jgi:hypothetical protein
VLLSQVSCRPSLPVALLAGHPFPPSGTFCCISLRREVLEEVEKPPSDDPTPNHARYNKKNRGGLVQFLTSYAKAHPGPAPLATLQGCQGSNAGAAASSLPPAPFPDGVPPELVDSGWPSGSAGHPVVIPVPAPRHVPLPSVDPVSTAGTAAACRLSEDSVELPVDFVWPAVVVAITPAGAAASVSASLPPSLSLHDGKLGPEDVSCAAEWFVQHAYASQPPTPLCVRLLA